MSLNRSFPRFLGFALVLAALLTALTSVGVWAQGNDACGPAPAVKAALDRLPQQTPAQTAWEFYQERLAAYQALLRQYPDDVFVQKALIEITRWWDREKKTAEYKARHEQNPDDARLAYLYGLTLVGRQTPEAIKLFNAALEKDRAFVLPHQELVDIYNSRAFPDKTQSLQHLQAHLAACPNSFEDYWSLTRFEDKDLLLSYAVKLRALIETRTDVDAVDAYPTLWALEFKVHPSSEQDALRRQVGQDLVRLKQLPLEDKPEWYQALQRGYELVGDKKQADGVQEQWLTRFPLPCATVAYVRYKPAFPGADSPPDKKHAFWRDFYERSGQWLKERPNCDLFAGYRCDAVDNLDDIPAAEVEAVVEQAFQTYVRNAGPRGIISGGYRRAVEILSKKHLEPERVVEWAQKGLAQWDIESKAPPYDLSSKEQQESNATTQAKDRLRLVGYEIDGYLQLKQAEKAQEPLERMDRWLQEFKSLGGKQNAARTDAGLYAVYWGLRARAAEFQGRKQDAMAFYQSALLARLTAQEKPETGRKDELADSAHQLWKDLGGTEEGWQVWYGRSANDLVSQSSVTWQDTDEPLPAFELTDLDGKTWNLTALKGKTVLLTFWATWCGACIAEFPRLEKLTELYKGRTDILFISFNSDANPGLIRPLLKEHKLTSVVIPAYNYVQALNVSGMPSTWIVDANGVVRLKTQGYATDKWEIGMKDAIEKVGHAGSAAAASGASP